MREQISRYAFRPGPAHGFEVVDLHVLFQAHKELLVVPHRTDFYHIIWFQDSVGAHMVDFKAINVKKNSLLFLARDKVQIFDPKGSYRGKALLFTENFFCLSADDRKFLRESFLFDHLFDNMQVELGRSQLQATLLFDAVMAEASQAPDERQHVILKNYVQNLIAIAERTKSKQGLRTATKDTNLGYVTLFRDLLESHFRKDKQVAFYASKLNVTEKRLNQATAKVLGLTPKRIIDERILLEAKRMLIHTGITIKEIAFALGFEEPTNFIKYFKKHAGQTPIEFRESFF